MEDYKKKYEEALERAKGLYNCHAPFEQRVWIEDIFPELKESEDERIRKEIIRIVDMWTDSCPTVNGIPAETLLTWLKKQGEKKLVMIQWKGNNLKEVIDFTGKDKNFEKWFKSFEEYEKYVDDHNGVFKLFNPDGSHYEVPIGSWIVKTPDGYNVASKAIFKQKQAWSEEDEKIYQSIIDDTVQENQLNSKQTNWLRDIKQRYFQQPKQEWSGEDDRISTDEVEPKFKAGNWYICVKDFYGKGVRFDKGHAYHCGLNGCLQEFDSGAHIAIDKNLYDYFNLWTIQNASDGDVIYENSTESIILFKSKNCGWIETYCSYWQKMERFEHGESRYGRASEMNISPATEEQRGLLFQRMKEAGYEWDADKKELKKIGQEEDVELTDFESALFSAFSDAWQEYLNGKEVNIAKWTREHSAELLEIARAQYPTPVFSEEDEKEFGATS